MAALISGPLAVLGQTECSVLEAPNFSRAGTITPASCASNNPLVNSGGDLDLIYSLKEFWVPDANTPIKTVKIAIHFFPGTPGVGIMPENQTTFDNYVNIVMASVNHKYSYCVAPSDPAPGLQSVTDSKIRFELDDRLYWYYGTTLNTQCDLSAKIQYVANNYPDRSQYLGVYVVPMSTPCPPGQWAYNPSPNWINGNLSNASVDNLLGVHMHMNPGEEWGIASTMAHELGHCLDLFHTYFTTSCCAETCNASDREYMPDVFGTIPQPNCLTDGWWSCDPFATGNTCTNNLLGASNVPGDFWISPLQAGKMHRAASIKSLKQYVQDTYQPEALVIAQNQTWDFQMRLYRDVRVLPGATLTLKCKLEMPEQGRIIVEPGARLVIDGGYVTSSYFCGPFWQGVQAWGTSAQHQYGSPIPTYQALVIVKNGGYIEHALLGVQTQNPADPSSTGGVVQVQGNASQTGGTFLNCQKAVDFDAYQNFLPSNPATLVSNRSYFNFCDFIIDGNYRGTATDFEAHVDLWKVDGLRFKGCTWQNLRTSTPANNSWELGQGILSLDAKFTVSGACTTIQPCCLPCPEANLIRSTFTGLDHGIDASVAETDRAFLVTGCAFSDNVVGVYSRNVNSFQLLRSNFNGGGREVTLDGALDGLFLEHRGVFTSGGNGFRIEENRFELTSGATNDFAGAWVNNSGEYNDVVYKNTAINCKHGFVGEGLCNDPANEAFIGLQFLCNTNNNPTPGNDIFDKKVVGAQNEADHSIRTHQGSQSKPAGNVFTLANPPTDASDFRNNTDLQLNYWHLYPSIPQFPDDVTPWYVGRWSTWNNNSCPSNFTTGLVHPFTTTGVVAVKAAFNTAKTAYVNTAYSYNALLNGGNTDQLINEVEHSWPEDAWELRNALIERSPHVTEEVLRAVAQRNTLPQAMLLEVLLANPDATKQNGFIKWIEFDAPYPLPTYMIELIVGSWEERTFRTQLETSMAQQHADMSVAANLLISECKSDTTGEDTDSTLVYWKRLPSFGARYSEALLLIQRGDYGQATTLLNNLEGTYRMNGYQLAERNNGLSFIAALSTAHAAGRDILHLTAAERSTFRSIAGRGCDRPAQWAQNLLCYAYGECTAPCTGGGATQRSLIGTRPVASEPVDPLIVYPNPANTFATFAYELQVVSENTTLIVRSIEGAELRRIPVYAAKGQYLLDTREFAPGTYTVDLVNAGNRISIQRFVLKP